MARLDARSATADAFSHHLRPFSFCAPISHLPRLPKAAFFHEMSANHKTCCRCPRRRPSARQGGDITHLIAVNSWRRWRCLTERSHPRKKFRPTETLHSQTASIHPRPRASPQIDSASSLFPSPPCTPNTQHAKRKQPEPVSKERLRGVTR